MDVLSGGFEIIDEHRQKSHTLSHAKESPTSTFNLGRTPEQSESKAQVFLPYLRAQVSKLSLTHSERPILAEDYDEEDPDQDLEL